jgi:ribosome-associated protein
LNTLEFAHGLIKELENKMAEDILLLDVSNIVMYTDLIILCTASSKRQLNALADAILFKKIDSQKSKGKKNGGSDSGWIVIDYGDLVVHLLDEHLRQFYNLTELWKNGKTLLTLK